MKFLLCSLVVCYAIISSGAIFDLLRDGGAVARYEGVATLTDDKASFAFYLEKAWLLSAFVYITVLGVKNEAATKVILDKFKSFVPLFVLLPFSLNIVTSIQLLMAVLLVIVLIELGVLLFDAALIIKSLYWLVLLILAVSILVSLFVPSYGVSLDSDGINRWQGVFSHKNAFALFCFFGIGVQLAYRRSCITLFDWVVIFATLIAIYFSGSYTGLVCSLLLLVCFFLLSSINNNYIFNACCKTLSILLIATVLLIILFDFTDGIQSIFGKDLTFSGRTDIWNYAIEQSNGNWLVGHGLNTYAQEISVNISYVLRRIGYVAFSTHNGYIDLYYSLGMVGVVWFAYFCIRVYKTITNSDEWRALGFSLILTVGIYNLFESTLFSRNLLLALITVVYYLSKSKVLQGARID